jgi:uncharacterized protein YkwD
LIVRVRLIVIAVSAVTVAAILFIAWPRDSGTAADPCGAVGARPSEIGLSAAGSSILCLLNKERTQRGLPALRQNPLLDAASLEHSRDMVRERYFEHTAKDGRTVADRLRSLGYRHGFTASVGENIAYGVGPKSTPASIMSAWMHSPPHRADILRPAFTEIGIGIALGSPDGQDDSATYTTDFGGTVDPSLPNS